VKHHAGQVVVDEKPPPHRHRVAPDQADVETGEPPELIDA
jgi:hypothetical protein